MEASIYIAYCVTIFFSLVFIGFTIAFYVKFFELAKDVKEIRKQLNKS